MKKQINPARTLILGFLSIIAIGSVLLMMPFSTVNAISPVDAVFTATSAVCVTGLIVKDTPRDFTIAGQIIIMLLIQIGGLGYMTSATIISLVIGKKIGLGERLIMKEALNVINLEGIVRFTKAVLLMTLLFEFAGAVLLSLRFMGDLPGHKAVYYGIFHSISAFNNAGFSLFSDNLMKYRGDVTVTSVISALVITGGIGFIVVSDLYNYWKKKVLRISVHTKIVLVTTFFLILTGAVLIYYFEHSNPGTFRNLPLKERLLASYFASVSPRTAGFNTVDYSYMKIETLFLTIILMFIGASPGSTGGGVKTTVFAIVLASMVSIIRSMRDTVIFKRRIALEIVSKAHLLIVLGLVFVIIMSLTVIRLEHTTYLASMFEVTSAFGTVGL
ncbi:MAG: TrkH family potassium uptake protein, partial [Nitrospirota bacterium]|nr:TrkH family potassium uptake protein [Nitrospirota bacterium]